MKSLGQYRQTVSIKLEEENRFHGWYRIVNARLETCVFPQNVLLWNSLVCLS